KYPHIVLEYLVSRIKSKPTSASILNNETSLSPCKITDSPVTVHSESQIQHPPQKQKTHPLNTIDGFFSSCAFCSTQIKSSMIFDYDAVVPMESDIAYPVVFQLTRKKTARPSRIVRSISVDSQES